MNDFIGRLLLFKRGNGPQGSIRIETPAQTWAYDHRPTMGRPQQAHMTSVMYRGEDASEHFLMARCGMSLWMDYEFVDVEEAEDFCERCLMADTHMVYTFYDAAGVPLYVGQSGEVIQRMLQHRISSPWFWWSATAEAKVVDRAEALKIESARIREIDPVYNKLPRRRGSAA